MTNPIDAVVQESERFLREEVRAEKCRIVNLLEFIELVSENNLTNRVNVRKLNINQTPFTQAYVELNGEYVYSTIID